MPPFFAPRKPKPPVRLDPEQQVANSHYYTAFKVILKITVIALVICIAFLPTVALHNKHKQHSDEPVVNDLEHPTKLGILTELDRRATHVLFRFVKSAKLLLEESRNRNSLSDELTKPSASEQVERSEQVADDTADDIRYGDYTLGDSIHQAKFENEPTQECLPEVKRESGGRCPGQPILPIRDDDRVVLDQSCTWQERRKHGGKCEAWRPTPRSLIASEDAAPLPAESRNNKHFNRPRSTLLMSRSTPIPTPAPTPQVIETCSYESAIKNGGRCPHGLVNGQNPTDNKPISITVRIESHEPNTEQQPRGETANDEIEDITAAYPADFCPPPWHYVNGWCTYLFIDDNNGRPVTLTVSEPGSRNRQSRGEDMTQKTEVATTPVSASTSTSTTIHSSLSTGRACEPPWIRTKNGRCIYAPKYQSNHHKDTVSRPRRSRRQRRGAFVSEEREVDPSWEDDSCEPPLILISINWCIYLPGYEHGTDDYVSGTLNATAQPMATARPIITKQPTVTEQPTATAQPSATAQPTVTEEPTVIVIAHCVNDAEGHLHCVKVSKKVRQISSVHHRRGFWPDDWIPQIEADCDPFIGTYAHYQCMQLIKHKNIGLKMIMVFLILAGFGSLIFLVITCANRASRPKAQPFRQVCGVINANGMTQHGSPMCANYPWINHGNAKAHGIGNGNGNANGSPMNGERWARGPPAYDPMRQHTEDHSGSLVACSRDFNCGSGSTSRGTDNWIRKLCNKCFGNRSSSPLDPVYSAGMMRQGPRIDTLRLPNANLATVRRASGLVPSEVNGRVSGSGSLSVRGSVSVRGESAESAESAETAETVVLGSEYGRGVGVGMGRGAGVVRNSGSGVRGLALGSGSGSGNGRGRGHGNGLSGVTLTHHGNLSGDTVVEPEAAMMKSGHLKKVEFVGLTGLEEVEIGSWRFEMEGRERKGEFGD
ncbi:hypothetical protein SBOR_7396 [Sclerotinia borealis F-4128]|uniref:Uncharacterized protein n=1 Tax=Sclerotinia borealis (strain F-4128) TaxID=1432307 RepID=W9C8P8_SCLBF|nr:hypothetical protein SBOR_7396 [Sclerotinia borealis F-4128]